MNLTLFDLDGTLIPVDSDHAFGGFMVDVGWVDASVWGAKNDEFFAQYNAGTLDLPAYVDFATSAWRGRPLAEALAMRERFMAEVMKPALRPAAVALVEKHRAAGDLIALVTATNEFVTAPIADAFGIEHLIAVKLVRDAEGRYTGGVDGVPSFREGKIRRVDDWLQGLGAQWRDFERINFYSDSTNDLPLLERVSHPVATNPSPTLAQIATERGWPQLHLFA
ncbi:HAD family hydrolase [Roseateles saccharophilus]|uniref:HAD superfamily hydrolase (TIGR01490 family) n=1 Tax=Roseateles saccharophilus TaxID=304 RepID=A0A4V2VRZ2_ROSSA|nr:HAD family hydrolase [Roseateles saccharophilus]MDG0832623.1 HAD family hydrolase [Roseateles saccharophilus]TCV00360.1 HAD superfamily hydrolase (TIGR01490 family) [Roseateles saccharophilus]